MLELATGLGSYRSTGNSSVAKSRVTVGWVVAFATLCIFTGSGCARSLATIDSARDAFYVGDLATARTTLEDVVKSGNRFSDPAELDLAIVELAAGDVDNAISRLRGLRDRFDETSKVTHFGVGGEGGAAATIATGASSIAGEAISMVSDDTARRFQPAGYEEVMIRTMLSVCSLAGDASDAESYINQAAMHQAKLRQYAEARRNEFFGTAALVNATPHQELALAPYLRGVLREATHHDFDDAKRNYQLVSSIAPHFSPAFGDLDRATGGQHSAADHGVLYVIAMVGRGPVLQATDAAVTSAAVSIASTLMLHQSDKEDGVMRLPKITTVKIPAVHVPPSPIAAITVAAQPYNTNESGVPLATPARLLGATQSITNLAEMVQIQNDAEQPWVIARSFVRQAGKELAVSQARQGLGLDGAVGTMFQFATTTAWTATETADTRCWGLLPREIQILRAELPVGENVVYFAPVGPDGYSIGEQKSRRVYIENGRNTYQIVLSPTNVLHVVGK